MNDTVDNAGTKKKFEPVFIVGAPRSGTTLLAVLLDRHSKVAIPPETQFFADFLPSQSSGPAVSNRNEKVEKALSYSRIKDIGIAREQLVDVFSRLPDTWPCLLQAILESYAIGQKKKIIGEKSPKHIAYVPEILEAFPDARILCLVRDGRDVVRSLEKVPWAEPGNPRRTSIFCMEWVDYAGLALKYQRQYSKEQFLLVKYEDILLSPTVALEKICKFIGEEFEEGQLQVTAESNVVPGWEGEWKNKSTKMLDSNRVEAWRRQADNEQIWFMNSMMGKALDDLGYNDTDLKDCPFSKRLVLFFQKLPCLPVMRPVSLVLLRVFRSLKLVR